MAKKYEFKPDKPRSGLLSKLYLTPKQRLSLLKWLLYAALLLMLSVVQDVLLCRMRFFGATTELVPCGIFLICLAEGLENGCVMALISSCLYLFSGTAAGHYSIVFITGLAILVTLFRQSYLQKSFGATMLCTCAAMLLYEVCTFAFGLFLSQTLPGRIGGFLLTAGMTLLAAPVLYPLTQSISKIGGETSKE